MRMGFIVSNMGYMVWVFNLGGFKSSKGESNGWRGLNMSIKGTLPHMMVVKDVFCTLGVSKQRLKTPFGMVWA
jgi:hypothetical protein